MQGFTDSLRTLQAIRKGRSPPLLHHKKPPDKMIKDILQNNENIQPAGRQMEMLRKHFPACFNADGAFDIERFRAEISTHTDVVQEGYELKFLGKSYAKLLASTDTTTIIQPDEVHNALPENANSRNIYISGDNLDGLKHLLKSYYGRIKCIYIDPPYNTGSDGFVYTDNFNFTREALQDKLNVSEDEAARILDLTKRGSASHSAWLMFLYSRLLLARDLLADDGVIFISIDDNEQANLKLLCDDVFGEENFVNQFAWISNITGRQISGYGSAKTYENILAYAKDVAEITEFSVDIDFAKRNMPDAYKGFKRDIKTDEYGEFAIGDTLYNHNRMFNEETRRNLVFSIFYNPKSGDIITGNIGENKGSDYVELLPHKNNDGIHKYHAWRWSRSKIENEKHNLIVLPHGKKGYEIHTKSRGFQTTLLKDIITNISNGDSEVKELFGGTKVFDYPKSVNLLQLLLSSQLTENSIILDFFSGSGTTAHAVLQLNAIDGGGRQFITIQLPELLNSDNQSQNAPFDYLKKSTYPPPSII